MFRDKVKDSILSFHTEPFSEDFRNKFHLLSNMELARIRSNLGLEPIERIYQHQEHSNENYFEELNDYLGGTMNV